MGDIHRPEAGQQADPPSEAAARPPSADAVETFASDTGNQRAAGMLARDARLVPELAQLEKRGAVLKHSPVLARVPFPTTHGKFEYKMVKQELAGAGGASGVKGTIEFEPDPKSPYTTKLGLIQIVKLQDDKGKDVDSASMPAASMPSLRTKEDKKAGIDGGYSTDVLHNDFVGGTGVAPKNKALSPYYPFGPGGPAVSGFRRSEKKEDIGPAKLFDGPGTTVTTGHLKFDFETVAKGDDNQHTYGSLKWGLEVIKGKVTEQTPAVTDAASATFDSALEKHREFYVHEDVTIYFDFDSDTPSAGEDAKFVRLLPYLTKFPDVRITAEGFADLRGNVAHNRSLAQRRAQNTVRDLQGRGIDAARFAPVVAAGDRRTSSFSSAPHTTPGATPQDAEANRRANRRVVLKFTRGGP